MSEYICCLKLVGSLHDCNTIRMPSASAEVPGETRESYRQQLLAFLGQQVEGGDRSDMSFPASLTGAERKMVHEV